MSLLTQLFVERLSEPSGFIRALLAFLVGAIIVKIILNQRQERKLYAHLPTFGTSWFLGNILGHMEHFWMSGTHLPVTVCK